MTVFLEKLSKGQTLNEIRSKLTVFHVPELLVFDAALFMESRDKIVNQIVQKFRDRKLIIRSSAYGEDGSKNACAGEYDSVLNVDSTDCEAIILAIGKVIDSYERSASHTENDEFIVQEMLLNTSMSGVVFTHDLNTGAPYYVINYDDVSGLTDTVTSGGGEYANRTLYIHRGATDSIRSDRFQILLKAIFELEKIMNSQFLDVEFALGVDFTPYLLQVRAITTQPNWNRAVTKRIDAALHGIQTFLRTRLQPMTGVYGNSTVLGQMPDWNPAEMIGRAPRALAFSLYKTLITDHAWRIARKMMGYTVPHGQPLMVSLAGQPFIDTRLSFHSFLPDQLSPEIGEKVVDAWIRKLRNNPELHDKVEFEIAITTYTFDIDDRLNELKEAGIYQHELSEFKELLRQLTFKLLTDSDERSISNALAKIEVLAEKQTILRELDKRQSITKLFEIIDDCVQFGTIPFSVLARHGFIAQSLLQSLNNIGILTSEDIHNIQSSVRTVASDLVDDMHRIQLDEISHSSFMEHYGHLRPGTYDILSQRYDQMSEFCTNKGLQSHAEKVINIFELDIEKKRKIDEVLEKSGFSDFNADDFLDYIQAATKGREYGKFVFTRSVSDMLELIAEYGERHGLSREEMSYISIDNLLEVATTSIEGSIEERLRHIAEEEAEKYALSVAIRLPQVLSDEEGVHVVPFQVSHPNFITHKKITARCIHLLTGETQLPLNGKIVLIENADPGFDWIFSQNIGGLITKYGGANSHMAIRCAEFGIPAAIGCGEQRFDVLVKAEQILLDCSAGLINSLH